MLAIDGSLLYHLWPCPSSLDQGYVSIGCEPCTRPVLPGQHEREGRWWWEDAKAKECGLHKGNIDKDGSPVRKDSRRWHHSMGNVLWHTDSSYHQQRSKYSILLSHGNPVKGGSWTHFADTRRAYADLPEDKKREIEDMIVEHE